MEYSEESTPQPETLPPSQRDGVLYLPENCTIPTGICICCGKKATKIVTKALRNPRNPKTWYSRQPCIEIGLCKKHAEDNSVGIALTLSVLGIGIAIFIAGIFTVGIPSLIIGFIAILFSGVFRARSPIHTTDSEAKVIPIHGVSPVFLEQFPLLEIENED